MLRKNSKIDKSKFHINAINVVNKVLDFYHSEIQSNAYNRSNRETAFRVLFFLA